MHIYMCAHVHMCMYSCVYTHAHTTPHPTYATRARAWRMWGVVWCVRVYTHKNTYTYVHVHTYRCAYINTLSYRCAYINTFSDQTLLCP